MLFLCAQPWSCWCSTRSLAYLWLTMMGSWLVYCKSFLQLSCILLVLTLLLLKHANLADQCSVSFDYYIYKLGYYHQSLSMMSIIFSVFFSCRLGLYQIMIYQLWIRCQVFISSLNLDSIAYKQLILHRMLFIITTHNKCYSCYQLYDNCLPFTCHLQYTCVSLRLVQNVVSFPLLFFQPAIRMLLYAYIVSHSIHCQLSYLSHDSGNGLADTNTNLFPDVDSTWKVLFIFSITWSIH